MKRREVITLLGGAAAWPLVARAQQPGKLPTIAFLGGNAPRSSFNGLRLLCSDSPPTYPVRPLIRFRLRVKMPSGSCCCSARATSIQSRAIFNNGSRIAGSSVMPASLIQS